MNETPVESFYYVNDAGQSVGPFSLSELREMADKGVIKRETLVCPAGGEEWQPLSSFLPAPVGILLDPETAEGSSTYASSELTGKTSKLAPWALGAGIISILLACAPILGFVVGTIALILGLQSRQSSQRGLAIGGIATAGVGMMLSVVGGLLFVAGGGGEATEITRVMERHAQILNKVGFDFPNSPPAQARYIAVELQKVNESGCPGEFRRAYQQHVNAWRQAEAYFAANTSLNAFLEGLYSGYTGDYSALGFSGRQAAAAAQQVSATYFELVTVASEYGGRVPNPGS